MNKTAGLLLFGAAVAMAGLIIYRIRSKNTFSMLTQVSDEGYETAHDVLFPRDSNRGRRVKYGPVIPRR